MPSSDAARCCQMVFHAGDKFWRYFSVGDCVPLLLLSLSPSVGDYSWCSISGMPLVLSDGSNGRQEGRQGRGVPSGPQPLAAHAAAQAKHRIPDTPTETARNTWGATIPGPLLPLQLSP